MHKNYNSQRMFDKLQEATHTGWWAANVTKRTLTLSSYLVHLFGLDASEISFDTFKKLLHPDSFNETYAKIRNILLYPDDIEEVLSVKTIYGYQNIYIKHIELSTDEEDQILTEGYAEYLGEREVTIKKNSKQDFLHKLYQNMPLGYYRLRLEVAENNQVVDFEYLDANSKFLEIVGMSRKELIGKMNSEIGISFIDNINIQALAEVAFHGKVLKEQMQFKATKRYYENTVYSPRKGDVVVLFADITELLNINEIIKKNEQKLSKIYENIPIGIEIYDKDGYMISANEKAASIQGLPGNEMLIGLNLFNHPLLPLHAHEKLKAGKDVTFDIKADRNINHTYYSLPQDNYFRYLTIKCTVIYKYDQIDSYLVIVIDNTEMYEINASLEKEKLKAEESDRLKSQFLSNMSHEIRTPLNSIVGFSDLLMYTDDEEEKAGYIDIIKRNNELLLQLINEILDLSRIESDRMEFFYNRVDINKMLASIEASCKLKLDKSPDVKVILTLDAENFTLFTEENRVHQVLLNFVNNAIKFTEKGHIEIGYQIREDKAFFYVSDTGKGISKEKQADIFKRFVKLDEFATGTGLGLSICETILKRLHGEIGVYSEEGKGSTFWFTLPIN